MNIGFKYAEHIQKESRFSELADDVRELIEADINWKENPRPFLKKLSEKIKEKSQSLLTFGESEVKFAIFLDDYVKQAAKAPPSKNPAVVKILNRRVENVADRENEIILDMGTIAKLIIYSNKKSTDGLSKFVENTDDEILHQITDARNSAKKELEKPVGGFNRKPLD